MAPQSSSRETPTEVVQCELVSYRMESVINFDEQIQGQVLDGFLDP